MLLIVASTARTTEGSLVQDAQLVVEELYEALWLCRSSSMAPVFSRAYTSPKSVFRGREGRLEVVR